MMTSTLKPYVIKKMLKLVNIPKPKTNVLVTVGLPTVEFPTAKSINHNS